MQEPFVVYREGMLTVEVVLFEKTAIQIWSKLQCFLDFAWELLVASMKSVVERLEEHHFQPFLEKRVQRLFGIPIGGPEGLQEIGVATQPSLALDEIEEHDAIHELECMVVRPRFVFGLLGEVVLQYCEESLVFFEKYLCEPLLVECAKPLAAPDHRLCSIIMPSQRR
ncbi:MAG: hypothetical protein A2V87_00360 [Deltaproteobacteria bacterium RBG_16_58_17]|nr:MAG: hypothetical protein A2V87_00360 [Deltaproteobacteria bacterium RBG_16_58_17]